MVDTESVSRIAQKIKASRLAKGLTMQELCSKAMISKGLLSKIENSRTIPSLPVLVNLVRSLDVSLKEFFEDMVLLNGRDFLVIRKNSYNHVTKEGRPGFHYLQIMSQNIPGCTLDVALLTIEPGAKGRATTTDGYEFKYVLSGSCEYRIGDETVQLDCGYSIYFDASKPHLPVNQTRKEAVMLVVYFLINK
ncbi:MAG: XRE family transcriptional regulator [Cyclobacteriaceae bacterium]|nr:MAG: XRE family transcriptional regulator [Cyclobacteriaceae bacterium]